MKGFKMAATNIRKLAKGNRNLNASIKRLADKMDQHAENVNAHDFVITHRALAVLMYEQIGPEMTHKVFAKLSREGGLPTLTGVSGTGKEPFFLAIRGIAEDWGNWEIPEAKAGAA